MLVTFNVNVAILSAGSVAGAISLPPGPPMPPAAPLPGASTTVGTAGASAGHVNGPRGCRRKLCQGFALEKKVHKGKGEQEEPFVAVLE